MNKRYQVFISSTFQDLQPARQEVSQALLRSDCFPAGMELFPAANEEQFAYIKNIIDQSDYYIIISAGRYGSIHPGTGLSYTEMEYDYAVRTGKPVIRLLHRDPFNELRGEFIEGTDEGRAKLAAFRAKMEDGSLVRYWREPVELGAEVVHGMGEAQRKFPATGWVRDDKNLLSHDELRDSVVRLSQALTAGPDSFLDRLPVAALRVNAHGDIVYANSACRRIAGGRLEIGRELARVLLGVDSALSEHLARAQKGADQDFLAKAVTDAGEAVFQAFISRLDDLNASLLVVLIDVSQFKEVEAQFAQSQKMQAVGQLAAGVAHDFNNMLTAILGFNDLVMARHGPEDESFAELTKVKQNATRASDLAHKLLAFSRKQPLQPRTVELGDVLTGLGDLLQRTLGESIELRTILEPALPKVCVDPTQLESVIINLAINARDAMPEGGTVTIEAVSTNYQRELRRDGETAPVGTYVQIRVRDEGVGIAPEHRGHIFEPFFTTKPKGSGLGLSTAYGIVKQSGGYIFVETALGRGSTFEILLPAAGQSEDASTEALEAEDDFTDFTASGTILCAEDETSVREFATMALQTHGYTVIPVASGNEALRVLDDPHLTVDAFLSDVVTPGLDGPAWVAEARTDRPGVPALFVSGYSPESFETALTGIENSAFLPKPFTVRQLLAAIHKLVSGSARLGR